MPYKDPDYYKNWVKNNPEKVRSYKKKYSVKNKEKLAINQKLRNFAHPERHKASDKRYRDTHKEELNQKRRDRFKTDPNFKLRYSLRSRIKMALKKEFSTKAAKTKELLGASFEIVKLHIESQFKPGMTWQNYGFDTWHIDHIIPCASFDLTDPEQQKLCFHYTNLQPLWALDNLIKGSKN